MKSYSYKGIKGFFKDPSLTEISSQKEDKQYFERIVDAMPFNVRMQLRVNQELQEDYERGGA